MLSREQISTVAIFLVIAAISTCCGQARQGRLEGDVFIVTQGAENVKLGLVEVRVLSYQETKNSIAKTRAQAEQEIASLQPKLDVARKAVESMEARYKAAVSESTALNRAVESAEARYKAMGKESVDFNREAIRAAKDRYAAAGKAVDTAKEAALAAIVRATAAGKAVDSPKYAVTELEKQIRGWNSGSLYFASLPSPVASVKTDADGKFSMPVDRNVTIALAAYATRHVSDTIENYYWIVSMSLDGQPSKRILLSNDNLATSESKDSLVHVVE